jgi:hypothetical protein
MPRARRSSSVNTSPTLNLDSLVPKVSYFSTCEKRLVLPEHQCYVEKCVMSLAHILNMNQGAGLRTNTSITELDVSWNDINYTNYNSIELMVQTQANIYQQV